MPVCFSIWNTGDSAKLLITAFIFMPYAMLTRLQVVLVALFLNFFWALHYSIVCNREYNWDCYRYVDTIFFKFSWLFKVGCFPGFYHPLSYFNFHIFFFSQFSVCSCSTARDILRYILWNNVTDFQVDLDDRLVCANGKWIYCICLNSPHIHGFFWWHSYLH